MPRLSRTNALRVIAVGALAIGPTTLGQASAGAGVGNSTTIGQGPDHVYAVAPPAMNPLVGASATVSAGSPGGNEQITLQVTGVDAPAGTEFGAHVHVNPCGATGAAAGGHYAVAGDGPLQNREVWLDLRVDAHGRGHAIATRGFRIENRADRSVTIHAVGTDHETGGAGARLACIDLDA